MMILLLMIVIIINNEIKSNYENEICVKWNNNDNINIINDIINNNV